MFSKEEATQIKKEFWISFSEKYPRKWILYNTKIKDAAFKFHVDNKTAMVSFDIETKDEQKRKIYFEKFESLQTILLEEYMPDVIFERNYYLENGKCISRIWTSCQDVSLYNKKSWAKIFEFFNEKMTAFEIFYFTYEDYIKDLETNI
jgi:hypothetical protein